VISVARQLQPEPERQGHRRTGVELKGSVAIVTGVLGQRIGRALAIQGTQVAGIYLHSRTQAEALARE